MFVFLKREKFFCHAKKDTKEQYVYFPDGIFFVSNVALIEQHHLIVLKIYS